jgi:hypothetical protein
MHFWRIPAAAMRFAPKILARERASRAAGAASARLTSRQREGGFCIDPEQAAGIAGAFLHQFKTTAPIAVPR